MSTYTTPAFWKATAERAVKTAAQSAIASIGATALVHEVDWLLTGSATALAAILSVLTSIASAQVSDNGGPSLAGEQLPKRAQTEPDEGTAVGGTPPAELVPPAERVTPEAVVALTAWHDEHDPRC